MGETQRSRTLINGIILGTARCDFGVSLRNESQLVADDVRRAGALGGVLDLELYFRPFRQILSANVFHVKEHVLVGILSRNETVAASVVEEVNFTV